MKYGQSFEAQSVPQWAPYNVDYNDLKNLIKTNTTQDQARSIAIPGQADTRLLVFEGAFYNELSNQHDRVDLFVKSKADEIDRRLKSLRVNVHKLLARCAKNNSDGKAISLKRYEKFAKYDGQIEQCGSDIRDLQRFVAAQRIAFHKILKKYRKWTGSGSMGDEFNERILGNPKSFVRRDFGPLSQQYFDLLATLRASTPAYNGQSSPAPSEQLSRRQSQQAVPQSPTAYWNEYDDGSEGGEDEPYTVLVNPEDSGFPGEKYIHYIFSKAKKPVQNIKSWLSPPATPAERQPLLTNENGGYFERRQSTVDTDVDDEAYASSSNEFPTGYEAHYATLPSLSDQRLTRLREQTLFRMMILNYTAAVVMMSIAGILIATGRRKLRVEVDAGVIVGVVGSVLFALMGLAAMLYRRTKLSWFHRFCSLFALVGICALDGMLTYIMVGNSAL